VKGAEIGGGDYVVVEQEELDAVAPGRSRSLEITDFVDLADVDPVYFQRTYWLAPTDEQFRKPYALLRQAMEELDQAAVGTFVMRGKEYLAAIRADREVLALHTLHFADEIRDPRSELDNVPSRRTKPAEQELRTAMQLIESMSGPWKPDQYRDTYRDRVAKLIEDKKQGNEIVNETEPPDPTEMSDLLDALHRSVEAAEKGSNRKGASRRKGSDDKGDKAPSRRSGGRRSRRVS
jgi:DNA end-binding protein Ku